MVISSIWVFKDSIFSLSAAMISLSLLPPGLTEPPSVVAENVPAANAMTDVPITQPTSTSASTIEAQSFFIKNPPLTFQSFIPPRATPRIKYFCIKIKMITIGIDIRIEIAISGP